MNDKGSAILSIIWGLVILAMLGSVFILMSTSDAGADSVAVTDVETDELYITIVFSNGEKESFNKNRVDTSLIRSFKNHDAILYYKKVRFTGKYISDFKIFFEKNTTIKQVLYEKDGLWPWEHPPVRIIFSDGSNFKIYGSGDYKFDVYSKCLVHTGNQVLFKYYINEDLEYKFSSIKPVI